MTPDQRDRRDDWPSEMRRPETKPDGPSPPAARPPDVTAEIARHRTDGDDADRAWCVECSRDWPCLVRRLADEVAELTRQRGDALARVRRRERIIESYERGIASRDEEIVALRAAADDMATAVGDWRAARQSEVEVWDSDDEEWPDRMTAASLLTQQAREAVDAAHERLVRALAPGGEGEG